jgi:probable phosphoglycerate mutase
MAAATLVIVRHGETAWNAERRVQGQLDIPLNAVGLEQADAVGAVLAAGRFDAIYSSDLSRARQTAAPAARALGLEVALDERLRERHYGVFETLTYTECETRYPEDFAKFLARDSEFNFRTGESLTGFAARALRCLEEIAQRHAGESVLVFTHGGVLDKLYRRATGLPITTPREFRIPNAGINRVAVEGAEWRILAWADCAHLPRSLDDLPE